MSRDGEVLDGRYLLQELIATGGMGEVWKGVDQTLGREVAVKILRPELAGDPTFQARFRAEARTSGRLAHAGIAAVYDYGETQGASYLVMELVPGEPLSSLISQGGALGSLRTCDILAQTARALHSAHQAGVVHRDIKPANILVTPSGRVAVTDFGIAKPRDHEPLTATGQVMGTAHYLAPEVARGAAATPLSDVYALGVVMYECLAGWRPFDGDDQVEVATRHLRDTPPPLPDTVPERVREVVMTAMAKEPAQRPASALEFAEILDGLANRPRSVISQGALTAGTPGTWSGSSGGWSDRPTRERPAATPTPAPAARPTSGGQTPARPRGEGTSVLPVSTPRRSAGLGGRLRWPLVALVVLVIAVVLAAWFGIGGRSSSAGPGGSFRPTVVAPMTQVSGPDRQGQLW